MKNNIYTVVSKELSRFFKDKRLLFSSIILPGLMIYIMYSVIGNIMSKQFKPDDRHIYKVAVSNMPNVIEEDFKKMGYDINNSVDEEAEKTQVKDGKLDAILIFPKDFTEKVSEYDAKSGEKAPNIELYYNSASDSSNEAYRSIKLMLGAYEDSINNKFDINNTEKKYDLATDKEITGKVLGIVFPMFLMLIITSSCIGTTMESIVGEKERGTIATLLVTPLNRSDLAIGKIVSISIISVLSATSSFVGIAFSIDKIIPDGPKINVVNNISYSPKDLIMMFLVIILMTLFNVALLAVISINSKNMKEATLIIQPVMFAIFFVGLSPLLAPKGSISSFIYLMPIANSTSSISAILKSAYTDLDFIMTIVSNAVGMVLLIALLTKMYNSERIIFNKQ